MTTLKKNNTLLLFLLAWTLLNLIQAYYSELTSDEPYYWLYAQQLDWGYFDHPPLLAFLIHLGTKFFPDELGTRFFIVLLSTGTVYLLFQFVKDLPKVWFWFPLTLFALPLFHQFAFYAIPDGPLMFFTALFFYLYKQYLEKERVWNILGLMLCCSLLLYTKYHGILVLFFTLLSNLKLLRKPSFWLIAVGSLLLFLPHLYWQYQNDFITFEYHLSGRGKVFKFRYFTSFLLEQAILTGPIVILWQALRANRQSTFDRALYFTMVGIFLFFATSSIRGLVHFHWTSAAFIPLVVLFLHSLHQSSFRANWIRIPMLALLVFVVLMRIYSMYPIFPLYQINADYFHHTDDWAEELADLTQGNPPVFTNNFKLPAFYSFYTHKLAHTLNNISYKNTQHDLWNYEDSIQGRTIYYFPDYPLDSLKDFQSSNGLTYSYTIIPNFQSFYRLPLKLVKGTQDLSPSSNIKWMIQLSNPYNFPIDFQKNPSLAPYLELAIFRKNKTIQQKRLELGEDFFAPLAAKENRLQSIDFSIPDIEGNFHIVIGIGMGDLKAGRNSGAIPVTIR